LILYKWILEMCQYYSLKENKIIHMNYVYKNTFLFKVFSSKGIEIEYSLQLITSTNDDSNLGGYDPPNDVESFSQVSNS